MRRKFLTAMPALLAAGLFGGLLATAEAQQATTSRMEGLALSSDKPIQIESDQLQVKDKEGTAIFTGNVKVVQGETMMQSGVMTVYYVKEEAAAEKKEAGEGAAAREAGPTASLGSNIERIDVSDTVYIQSGEQTATADRGVFNMKTEVLELTGDRVVLSEGKNVFVGCKLTVFMKNGDARLDSCGGRVKIQLDPKSREKAEPQAGAKRQRKTN